MNFNRLLISIGSVPDRYVSRSPRAPFAFRNTLFYHETNGREYRRTDRLGMFGDHLFGIVENVIVLCNYWNYLEKRIRKGKKEEKFTEKCARLRGISKVNETIYVTLDFIALVTSVKI